MSMHAEIRPRVRDPAVALWTIAAACWVATVLLAVTGGGALGHHDVVVEQATRPWLLRIAGYQFVWTVMVGAMMLPTTVPMARLVAVVSARVPHPGRMRGALAASYLAVWLGFGLLALLVDTRVHAAVDRWPWLDRHAGLILAATLVLAGAFQFSRLKDRCLTACRDPFSMLWRHYGRGASQAWRLGIRHALNCLGCCWALMLVMFGIGAGSLAWMLLLTAVMVAEKTTRWGRRLNAPVGAGLLASGAVVALASFHLGPFASLLPAAA